jgi:DNA-binding SARP family transcriptional activator
LAVPQVSPATSQVVAAGLRIGVLGEMTAARDGESVDLGGPRQRAVLALLVLARGDVVPADRLADALWGEEIPPSATSALQAYVSHLRRRLEPDRGPRDRQSVIARQGPGYALRVADDAVDAWEFERLLLRAGTAESADAARSMLDRALALWRGPAYADHIGAPWADAESARLAGLRDVAREQRLEARLGTGEAAVLVPEIEAMVAEDPLREERWRLLVLALYRSHRQADALAALRRARTTLADELGVDPGPALRSLEAGCWRSRRRWTAPRGRHRRRSRSRRPNRSVRRWPRRSPRSSWTATVRWRCCARRWPTRSAAPADSP